MYRFNKINVKSLMCYITLPVTYSIPSCATTAGLVTAILIGGIICQELVSGLYRSTESSLNDPSHPPTAYTYPSNMARPVNIKYTKRKFIMMATTQYLVMEEVQLLKLLPPPPPKKNPLFCKLTSTTL